MIQKYPICFLFCIGLAITGLAMAQNAPTSRPDNSSDKHVSFPAGTWVGRMTVGEGYQSGASSYTGNGAISREAVTSVANGIDYYFLPDISFGLELNGLYASQPVHDSVAYGGSFDFRGHFLDEGNWTLFGTAELGMMEANFQTPPGGTAFNYLVHVGPGATVKLCENTDLIAGGGFLHVSNANIHGAHRNPSINGYEGYVGLLIRF